MPSKKVARPSRPSFFVVYALAALDDLDRMFGFLVACDPAAAERAAHSIVSSVTSLGEHPLIGRPLSDRLRALVVSFGNSGHVVLYRVRPRLMRVEILSIRHQREAGFV